jgi:hypothetical protein
MSFKKTKRKLLAKERRLLNLILQNRKAELSPRKRFRFLLFSLFIGVIFGFIASRLEDGIFLFLTGTIAVFAFVAFVFSIKPYLDDAKEEKYFVKALEAYINNGIVETSVINALKIADAGVKEDESNLFIIEFEKDSILFYWDFKYSLFNKFPCLKFEIYDDDYYKFTDRPFNFLSEKIDPITISSKGEWNYIKQHLKPRQFEVRNINFEDLIKEINSHA